jgi:hypothetical protein
MHDRGGGAVKVLETAVELLATLLVAAVCLALVAAVYGGIGWLASAALAFFGVLAPWWVCAVCFFLVIRIASALGGAR